MLRRAGAATIYVSQDYREAMALGDRVAILLDGKIAQLGAPEDIYDNPASVKVVKLVGDPPINLIPCRPTDAGSAVHVVVAGPHLNVRAERAASGRACLPGLRPETAPVAPREIAA